MKYFINIVTCNKNYFARARKRLHFQHRLVPWRDPAAKGAMNDQRQIRYSPSNICVFEYGIQRRYCSHFQINLHDARRLQELAKARGIARNRTIGDRSCSRNCNRSGIVSQSINLLICRKLRLVEIAVRVGTIVYSV